MPTSPFAPITELPEEEQALFKEILNLVRQDPPGLNNAVLNLIKEKITVTTQVGNEEATE
jgi:hypothetical protein